MGNKENCMTCGIPRSQMADVPWGRFIKNSEGKKEDFIQCKPCRAKELQDQIDAFQKSETDTTYEDTAICPHCGHKHESDSDQWEVFYQEGDHDFTCHNCDNDFTLQTMVKFSYSTFKL